MKSHFQIHGNYEKLKDSMPAVAFAMLGHSPESIVEGLFGGGWGLCGWVRSLYDFRGIPQGTPRGIPRRISGIRCCTPPVSKIF
jgi:hypothetical protein